MMMMKTFRFIMMMTMMMKTISFIMMTMTTKPPRRWLPLFTGMLWLASSLPPPPKLLITHILPIPLPQHPHPHTWPPLPTSLSQTFSLFPSHPFLCCFLSFPLLTISFIPFFLHNKIVFPSFALFTFLPPFTHALPFPLTSTFQNIFLAFIFFSFPSQ